MKERKEWQIADVGIWNGNQREEQANW